MAGEGAVPGKRKRTLIDLFIEENCFAVPSVDLQTLLRRARSAGISYRVVSKLCDVPESNLRHLATGRSKRTGRNIMSGYRITNTLLQVERALQAWEKHRSLNAGNRSDKPE